MDAPTPNAMTGWITLGNGEQRELAGMGRRLWARIIDLILLTVVGLIVIIVTFSRLGDNEWGFLAALVVITLLLLAVLLLYEVSMIATLGQTLGKKWAGVTVVRADNGAVPGWGKSFVRWLIPVRGQFDSDHRQCRHPGGLPVPGVLPHPSRMA